MPAVDFEAWAVPDLEIVLGGRIYKVRPPSVEAGKILLAAAVRGEVNLGLVKGEVPEAVDRVLATINTDEHPALGGAYEQMLADGVDSVTIERVAYYAVFYWARGKEYADSLATVLYTPAPAEAEGDGSLPKARPTSRQSSGRRSGSVNRSTKTRTASRSSGTTDSPPNS